MRRLMCAAAMCAVLVLPAFGQEAPQDAAVQEETAVLAAPERAQISVVTDGEMVSLDIKGMDIIDVLKMLAQRSRLSVVIGKNVSGRVTLFLKDVRARDAFDLIVLSHDLAYEEKGGIVNVMTQKDFELLYGERFQDARQAKTVTLKYAKAADVSKSLAQIKSNVGRVVADETTGIIVLIDSPAKVKEMEDFIARADQPVETRVFALNYAAAKEMSARLQGRLTQGIGSVNIDERTNKIAVTDYASRMEELARLVAEFDERTQQVLIDAQIVEVRPSDKLEIGLNWDYWIEKNFRISGSIPVGTSERILLGTLGKEEPAEKGDYTAVLDLLRTVADTKILSSPRIMALNNQEAKILVGTKEAYITSSVSQSGDSAVTAQTVNFVDTGIKLYVTPQINREGFVSMRIRPEISSAERQTLLSDGKETQIPIVTTSEAETTIMVKDGVTVVIGGLRKDEKVRVEKRVPFLGDIPLLGVFFRSLSNEVSKTDLVILLTPRIITGEVSDYGV